MSPLWAFILWQLSLSLFAFFWGGCPCCVCEIFEDLFTRANSTDISANWSEVAGDWSIVSNRLGAPATANAIAIYTGDSGQATVHVQVRARSNTSGDKLRLIVGYQSATDYFCGEVTFGATGTGALKIISRAGGVDTTLFSLSGAVALNADKILRLCVGDDGTIYFENLVADRTAITAGAVGVGTGGTAAGTMSFDEFHYYKAEGSCTHCCRACADAPPLYWDVTLPTMLNSVCLSCASHSGQTYRVTRCTGGGIIDSVDGDCVWSLSGLSPCVDFGLSVVITRDASLTPDYKIGVRAGTFGAVHCGMSNSIAWASTSSNPIDCSTTHVVPRLAASDSSPVPCTAGTSDPGDSITIVPVF